MSIIRVYRKTPLQVEIDVRYFKNSGPSQTYISHYETIVELFNEFGEPIKNERNSKNGYFPIERMEY